ncbi:MAG: ParM/StbA family protein [Chloroflexota bacterium]
MQYIGLDLGFGNIKIFSEQGGLVLPSHVATAGQAVTVAADDGLHTGKRPDLVELDGHQFYVGTAAHSWGRPIEALDYGRLHGGPEIRALVYGALSAHECDGPATLYVGLPLEPLSGDAANVAATVASIREWLCGRHAWRINGRSRQIEIAAVKISSQPAGAYFDYLLNNDGRPHPQRAGLIKEEVGVVSLGFNTLERLVLREGEIVQRFTAGSTSGVRRLLTLLNTQGDYTLGELDDLLRSGGLHEDRLNPALDTWGREVVGQLEATWGTNWRRFGRILLVGGGALILNGRLMPVFRGKATLASDPVLSIAKGLYKLALFHQQRGQA